MYEKSLKHAVFVLKTFICILNMYCSIVLWTMQNLNTDFDYTGAANLVKTGSSNSAANS